MEQKIKSFAADYITQNDRNEIQSNYALSPDLVGIKMYDEPLMGIGLAEDPYFDLCKEAHVIGPHFLGPAEWLPGARSVISFFLPKSKAICQSNALDSEEPSQLWLHARIEGQEFINQFCRDMQNFLEMQGARVLVPVLDQRFKASQKGTFTSNWSERHAAYACGLGTFGLSKGLITSRGVAGRLCSFITDIALEPTTRDYESYEEYCSFCGACVKRCPVGAISLESGKDHVKCGAFVENTRKRYSPRYGCGKCQVKVPCERNIPLKVKISGL